MDSQARLGELMTRNPVRVRSDERLDIALALMVSCRVRHLPVADDGRLVGMISFRDVQGASRSAVWASRGERALHLRGIEVRNVMSQPVISCTREELVSDAVRLLLDKHISALPIVDGQELVGIVTSTDLLRTAADTLEREPRAHGEPPAVRSVMSPSPITTLKPEDGLDVATTLMHTQHIHHLPVVKNDRVVGLLSDLDVLAAQSSSLDALAPAERVAERHWTHVSEAMEARAKTVSPDDSAADAARFLARRKLGCLPVVGAGRLVGMLTVTDFLHYLSSHTPDAAAATS